jgi:hypothetical protein
MFDEILFFVDAAVAGYAAHTKRWGWCVALSLLAIKVAIRIEAGS